MDVYLKAGAKQRLLTSELVHELIGDGCNSDLEDSDGEDLRNREAASAEICSEDELEEESQSSVRPSAEIDVNRNPIQNLEFLTPEAEPPSKRKRLTTRNRSSSQRRTIDIQPSSSGCPSPPALSTNHPSSTANSSIRGRAPVQRSNSSAPSSRTPVMQTNQRRRNWRIRPFQDKDHSGYAPRPATTVLTPLEYFYLYFDDQFFENAATCTNMYYMRHTGKTLNTTAAEIKMFYGILLVMGCISYPRIHMYWRQGMDLKLISNIMTRDRFFLLRNNLHVVSSDTPPPNNTNPLWKVQPAIQAVHNACEKIERTPGYYSIDEQIIPFTGRCRIRVLVRNKPRPLGLKNYVVTTNQGLMVNFEIYYPQNPAFDRSLGEGPGVILYLAQSIPRGSCIFFDRYFNTVPLLERLSQMDLHGTGTIMANRVPDGKKLKLTEKGGMKRGDIIQYVSGDVTLVKWKDNNIVLMASNCTGGDNVSYVPRWDKKEKSYVPVKAPKIVLNYNKNMGGVDVLDQTIEYYRTFQKTKKWTVKVLIHLLDLSVANAWRQFKIDSELEEPNKKNIKDLLWFRLAIADSLLNIPDRNRPEDADDEGPFERCGVGRYKPPPPPSIDKRYDGYDHLPIFDTIKVPRSCRMEDCKSRSKVLCSKCNIYLCLSRANNCFFEYHKKQ